MIGFPEQKEGNAGLNRAKAQLTASDEKQFPEAEKLVEGAT